MRLRTGERLLPTMPNLERKMLGKRFSVVAGQCGFLSLQSFSRTFRRVEGISPRAYLNSPDRQKNADSAEKI